MDNMPIEPAPAAKAAWTDAEFRAVAVRRVKAALDELGEDVTVGAIADRAGVSRHLADQIISAGDEQEFCEAGENSHSQTGPPRGEEIGVDMATDRPRHLARPGEPVDRLQRPLDQQLIPIFAARSVMLALMERLAAIAGRIKAIKDEPSGVWLDAITVCRHVEDVLNHLRLALPHCVCPSCGGQGRRGARWAKNCPTCNGATFLSEGAYGQLSTDLQRVANGYGADSV